MEFTQIEAFRALQVPGEEDVLAQVLDEYDAAELLEQMRQAAAARSLKSSSALLSAKILAAVCVDLEHLYATAYLPRPRRCSPSTARFLPRPPAWFMLLVPAQNCSAVRLVPPGMLMRVDALARLGRREGHDDAV